MFTTAFHSTFTERIHTDCITSKLLCFYMTSEKCQLAGSTAIKPVLTLYAQGLLIDILPESGDDITHLSLMLTLYCQTLYICNVLCNAQSVEWNRTMTALMHPLSTFRSAAYQWGHLILAPNGWPEHNGIFILYFNTVLSFTYSCPKTLFPSGFLTNFSCILQFSHVEYRLCPSCLQNFNTLTSGEEYKLWSILNFLLLPPSYIRTFSSHILLLNTQIYVHPL